MRVVPVFLLLFLYGTAAFAENKVALVIGNDSYPRLGADRQLKKARNDARSVGKTLEEIGFDVILGLDQNRSDFNRKLNEFGQRLSPGDVAFVYFSGHGVELDNRNYLLPSDFPKLGPNDEQLLRGEAIALQAVLDLLTAKGTRVNLIVVDACRDNPLGADQPGRGIGGNRGLARVEPPVGTFIMYAAAARQTALDRLGEKDKDENSVFTRLLLPQMKKKDVPIQTVAKTLQTEVRDLARTVDHDQRPAYYDGIVGHFCLSGDPDCGRAKTAEAANPDETPKKKAGNSKLVGEIAFLKCTKQNTADCYQSFVRDYPEHPRTPQIPRILANEVATPLYQQCMSGELVKCNRYKQIFPDGVYGSDVEQKILALMRPPEPRPADPAPAPGEPKGPEEKAEVPDSGENSEAKMEEVTILEDTDLPGNDYSDIRDISLGECRVHCENDPNCGAFSWIEAKRWCWMKTARGTAKSRKGMISGVMPDKPGQDKAGKAVQITMRPNLDLTGADYADRRNMTLPQCRAACADDPQCGAFSWVEAKRWCWMKTELGVPTKRQGVVSGAKQGALKRFEASR